MSTRVEKNLYIKLVKGREYYVVRFSRDGKRIERSLGRCDSISRAKAKRLAAAIQAEQPERKPSSPTFAETWERALADIALLKQWRGDASLKSWRHALGDLALPVLGPMRIDSIGIEDIVALLRTYWLEKPETAYRLRMRLEAFFAWAKVRGMCSSNPAIWRGGVDQFLPSRNKVRRPRHHEAPTLDELRKAVAYCVAHPSPVSGCLLFCIATVGRVSEVRFATRSEIVGDTWIMPPERRKDGKDIPHRVPLSPLAEIALGMARKEGLLFTATGAPLAADSPRLKLVKIIGREVTAHGIRSAFRDWCAQAGVADVLAEKSLSHRWGSEVTEAYLRTDLLEQRRPMMLAWSDELYG